MPNSLSEHATRLGEGETFLIYRLAERRASSVLVIAPASEQPTPESVQRLQRAFSLRAEIDPAWGTRPIALVDYDGIPSLEVEDPGGLVLEELLGAPLELGLFLRLAIAIGEAIAGLHGKGLLHRDLKPANILVDQAAGRAWLTGLCLSSLPQPESSVSARLFLGTPAYMAPEQSGRVNRPEDTRADLYSLGVILYRMASGTLPFVANDATEWVHCHIAVPATPLTERVPGMPGAISEIVSRLLQKAPEDRYQTVEGLVVDLRTCLQQWQAAGRITDFRLGQRDVPARLVAPRTIYGRASEINALSACLERVGRTGRSELGLVSGRAGVGKSRLLRAFRAQCGPGRAVFGSGKLDAQRPEIPYASLVQVIKELLQWILAQDTGALSVWRDRLNEALEPHGNLLTQLVPELELVMGAQREVPELAAEESRKRFHEVFRRFVRAAARPEAPLVLIFDDLQWVDSATIELLEHVLTDSTLEHLFVLGAARRHELDAGHRLSQAVSTIGTAGCPVLDLSLASLSFEDSARMVADVLYRPVSDVLDLARLISARTGGNPFYVWQFLATLVEDGSLRFEPGLRRWDWSLEHINARNYTENLAELVVERLKRLPVETLEALKWLAVNGSAADAELLAGVLGKPLAQLQELLRPALGADVVVLRGGSYAFLHDRLAEVALELIPAPDRAMWHLALARALREVAPLRAGRLIFDVVRHFNRAGSLLSTVEERTSVAELNFLAADRARESAAYSEALTFLNQGFALLADDPWLYGLDLFPAALARAECQFLVGDRGLADRQLADLSQRAETSRERAAVMCLRVALMLTQQRFDDALDMGLECLRTMGIDWQRQPDPARIVVERERLRAVCQGRSIAALAELPVMLDEQALAVVDVCTAMASPAYFVDKALFALLVLHVAVVSLEQGNTDASAHAYSLLTLVLGPQFGEHERGLEFGWLAAALVDQRPNRFEARVCLALGTNIVPRSEHPRGGQRWLRRAAEVAEKSGDLVYAGYARAFQVSSALSSGEPLPEVRQRCCEGLAFVQRSRFPMLDAWLEAQLALISQLTEAKALLADDEVWAGVGEPPSSATPGTFYYWVRRIQSGYLAGDLERARAATRAASRFAWTAPGFMEETDLWFFGALTLVGGALTDDDHGLLSNYQAELASWAKRCPQVFANKLALVMAEVAGVEGRVADAERLYEDSIQLARQHGFLHEEAVALERASHFWAGRGLRVMAQACARLARSCYLRWGALAKVRQLDAQFGVVGAVSSTSGAMQGALVELDLSTVVSTLQAVSSSIDLEALIDALVKRALHLAVGDYGLLVLMDEEPRVRALATTADGGVRVQRLDEAPTPGHLPLSVLNYVLRSRDKVVLNDTSEQSTFSSDDYLGEGGPRSLLCLPIILAGKLLGALYVENSLTTQAFATTSLELLDLLAAQAANSLENARLYTRIRQVQAFMTHAERVDRAGSFSWQPQTGVIRWSEGIHRIFGTTRAPTLELVRQRVHRDDLHLLDAVLADATLLDGRNLELRIVLPDGVVKHLSIVASRYQGNPGEPLEYVGAVRDISDAKRAEETLQRTQAALADMTRVASLGEMAAAIAHEVNQPLSAIALNASTCLRLLTDELLQPVEAREAAQRIQRDAGRASSVIQRVRALFSKAPGARFPLDLNDAISEVVSLARSRIRNSGASLGVELAEGLPLVLGDRVQLQQVILNLLINAIEAVADVEGRPRRIVVTTSLVGDQVRCDVKDSGRGIAEQEQARIFLAFYSTKPDGMGIGLSISKTILEEHGGTLGVEPNPDGHGVTFHFTVPIIAASPQ